MKKARMDMSLKTIFKIIRARWDKENSIFNNLKSECGSVIKTQMTLSGWMRHTLKSRVKNLISISY